MSRHLVPAGVLASTILLLSTGVAAIGSLENPQPGGLEAGIGVISGWHCTSRNIELRIDGVSLGLAGAGTSRGDTMSVCGRSDTGFSFLYNYNLLQGGTHKVDAYADGALFGSATFQVGYLGSEFLTGLSAAHKILDFPVRGRGTRVVWEQSKQDFVVAGMEALTGGSLVGTYAITNAWYQDSTGNSTSTLAPNVSASGTLNLGANNTFSLNFTLTINGQNSSISGTGTYVDNGYYMQSGGEVDLIIERGDVLTMLNLSQQSATVWATLALYMVRTPTATAAHAEAGASSSPVGSTGGLLHAIGSILRPSTN